MLETLPGRELVLVKALLGQGTCFLSTGLVSLLANPLLFAISFTLLSWTAFTWHFCLKAEAGRKLKETSPAWLFLGSKAYLCDTSLTGYNGPAGKVSTWDSGLPSLSSRLLADLWENIWRMLFTTDLVHERYNPTTWHSGFKKRKTQTENWISLPSLI